MPVGCVGYLFVVPLTCEHLGLLVEVENDKTEYSPRSPSPSVLEHFYPTVIRPAKRVYEYVLQKVQVMWQ